MENDLQDRGVDVNHPDTLARPWRFLRSHMEGVLTTPAVWVQEGGGFGPTRIHPVWRTRTQEALYGLPRFGEMKAEGA